MQGCNTQQYTLYRLKYIGNKFIMVLYKREYYMKMRIVNSSVLKKILEKRIKRINEFNTIEILFKRTAFGHQK